MIYSDAGLFGNLVYIHIRYGHFAFFTCSGLDGWATLSSVTVNLENDRETTVRYACKLYSNIYISTGKGSS